LAACEDEDEGATRSKSGHERRAQAPGLAPKNGVDFCAAAFTTYGGWGAEFRYRCVEPHFRSALKLAKANGGNGWDVVAEKQRLLRYLSNPK
jgi:hypothetical protein